MNDWYQEPICVAADCTQNAQPECPAPLCADHSRKVFAWQMIQAQQHSDEAPEEVPPQYPLDDIDGWVYFVTIGPHIKIGWSSYPKHRFKQLRPDAVLHMQPGTRLEERQLHFKFRHLLAMRREYFTPEPELLDYIDGLKHAAMG